jgi:hypothetical protein
MMRDLMDFISVFIITIIFSIIFHRIIFFENNTETFKSMDVHAVQQTYFRNQDSLTCAQSAPAVQNEARVRPFPDDQATIPMESEFWLKHGRQIIPADFPGAYVEQAGRHFHDIPARCRPVQAGRDIGDERDDWRDITPLLQQAWRTKRRPGGKQWPSWFSSCRCS